MLQTMVPLALLTLEEWLNDCGEIGDMYSRKAAYYSSKCGPSTDLEVQDFVSHASMSNCASYASRLDDQESLYAKDGPCAAEYQPSACPEGAQERLPLHPRLLCSLFLKVTRLNAPQQNHSCCSPRHAGHDKEDESPALHT